MKKAPNGILYDTDASKLIGTIAIGEFGIRLYRTVTHHFFAFIYGNGAETIEPLSKGEAIDRYNFWAARDPDAVLFKRLDFDEAFPD